MKILRVIASVDPATGGPVAGLRAITPVLASLGHTSEFLTVDEPTEGFLQSFVAPVVALGPAKGSYSYSPRVKGWLQQNVGSYDVVIVHGLWQYLGRVVHQVLTRPGAPPYFVYPHGMLDPGLRHTYPVKHAKKWLYWLLVEQRVLRDARAVFFTCEEERRLARTTFPFYRCNERVVAYGTASPTGEPDRWQQAWTQRSNLPRSQRYFLFLGRIHSKKGVDLLLRAYAKIYQESSELEKAALPHLVLAGPCMDRSYLRSLQAISDQTRCSEKVHWTGMLSGDAKWGAMNNADAFVLPSHQENFGIAVVEAMSCGTPVLLSDRVNIWRELAESNAALVEPPTEEGTAQLLRRWLGLSESSRQLMRQSARACFLQRFEVAHAARNVSEQLSSLIQRPISGG